MRTKVLPINDLKDLSEVSIKDRCYAVGIEEMSVTYVQQADTCSDPDDVQYLKVSTRCGVSPGLSDLEKRQCFYYDLSIPEGGHFSIDSAETLQAIIRDFEQRLYVATEPVTIAADEEN